MTCPRCGGPLETLSFLDRRAKVCESCGFVGVSLARRRERDREESWEEALRRFRGER